MEHLVASGATSLAFLGDTTGIEIADRLRGATEAATAAGVPIRHIPIPLATDAMGPEIEAAMASQCSGINGVVAASDLVAMAALRCLHQKGMRVPEDVQIVGFDDLPLAAQTSPPLTTIRQEIAAGARAMVERLRALVEKGTGHQPGDGTHAGRQTEHPRRGLSETPPAHGPTPVRIERSRDTATTRAKITVPWAMTLAGNYELPPPSTACRRDPPPAAGSSVPTRLSRL
ncbi:substrate-binding domain-containing protein [Novosphingobium colocasiae]